MPEVVYSAAGELRRPRQFLGKAAVELRRSLELAPTLLRANLRSRYRRKLFGIAWLLAPSLGAAFVAWKLASGKTLGLPPTRIPYPVFALTGMILWQLLAETLTAPVQQLAASRNLFASARVPHEAIVLAGAAEALIACALRLGILAVPTLLRFGIGVGPELLLLPLFLAMTALLGLALGMLVAPFGLLFEDVEPAVTMVATLWFFLTPVLYAAQVGRVLAFNPATPLIDGARDALTGGGVAGVGAASTVAIGSLLLLGLTSLLYRLAQPHIAARIG